MPAFIVHIIIVSYYCIVKYLYYVVQVDLDFESLSGTARSSMTPLFTSSGNFNKSPSYSSSSSKLLSKMSGLLKDVLSFRKVGELNE